MANLRDMPDQNFNNFQNGAQELKKIGNFLKKIPIFF